GLRWAGPGWAAACSAARADRAARTTVPRDARPTGPRDVKTTVPPGSREPGRTAADVGYAADRRGEAGAASDHGFAGPGPSSTPGRAPPCAFAAAPRTAPPPPRSR